MQYGFVKTAALTPSIRVGGLQPTMPRQIIEVLRAAAAAGAGNRMLAGALHHRLYLRGPVFSTDAAAGRAGRTG